MKLSHWMVVSIFIGTVQFSFSQDSERLKRAIDETKSDTTRVNLLSQLILSLSDEQKIRYNDTLYEFTKKKVELTPKTSVNYPVFQKYYAFAINQMGLDLMNNHGKAKEAVAYFNQAKSIRERLKDHLGAANIWSNLGYAYDKALDFPKSLASFEKALEIREKVGDSIAIGLSFYQIGVYYSHRQDIPNGLKYHFKALKVREKTQDKEGLAHSYNDIGVLFYYQEDIEQALKFYHKVLQYENKISDQTVVIGSYANIGLIYKYQGKLDKALSYSLKSLDLSKRYHYDKYVANAANNIGLLYQKRGDFKQAMNYFKESLALDLELNDLGSCAITYVNISNVYFLDKQYLLALENARKSLELAKRVKQPKSVEDAEWMHYMIYKEMGKSQDALIHYERFVEQRDVNKSEENQRAVSDMKYRYEYEKKAASDSIQTAGEKQLFSAKLKQEKTQRYALYVGLSLFGVFGLFMFNRFRVTNRQKKIIEEQEQKTNRQNELISLQKEEVEQQKNLVEAKQQEILDSISYAKRLQEAILPPLDFIQSFLPSNFVYYQPKDIVAGDFYWAESVDDLFFIAVADSTGHGVPGAMVSVVCSNALNRSVKEFGLKETGRILDKTRELVVETFAKNNSQVKDGMDISLICIDRGTKQVSWSGSNNSLWYIINNELVEVKADKQPIGKSDNPFPFTTHVLDSVENTTYYLFTDGFADQFGGPTGKKYKYKPFKDFLLNTSSLPLSDQYDSLKKEFERWKNDLEQVDDVCVLAFRY